MNLQTSPIRSGGSCGPLDHQFSRRLMMKGNNATLLSMRRFVTLCKAKTAGGTRMAEVGGPRASARIVPGSFQDFACMKTAHWESSTGLADSKTSRRSAVRLGEGVTTF